MSRQLDYSDLLAFDLYQNGYHSNSADISFLPVEVLRMTLRAGLQTVILPITSALEAHQRILRDELERSGLRVAYEIVAVEDTNLPPLTELQANIRNKDSIRLTIDEELLNTPTLQKLIETLRDNFRSIFLLPRIILNTWDIKKLTWFENNFAFQFTELVFPYAQHITIAADLKRIVQFLETVGVNTVGQYSLIAPPIYDPKLHTDTSTDLIFSRTDNSHHEIAVIIPLYNKAQIVQDVARCLVNQSLPTERFELIFVDDGSQDDTATRLLNSLFLASNDINIKVIRRTREVRHIPGQFSFTTGSARNEGIQFADADYLLFLDGDMLAADTLLEAHIEAHKCNAGSIVMGSRRRLKRGTKISRIAQALIQGIEPGTSCIIAEDIDSVRGLLDKGFNWYEIDKYPWLTCASSNVSIPMNALMRTGFFDPLGTLWALDDTDLFYRLYRTEFRYVYAHDATGFHCWHPPESNQVPGGREELFRLKTSIMFRKYLDPEILKANAYLFPEEFDYFNHL